MSAPPELLRSLGSLVEAVLRRLAGPFDLVGGAIARLVEVLSTGLLLVPQPVLVAAVGLAVWHGRRLGSAIVVMVSLQVLQLVGAWSSTVATLSLAVLAGAVGLLVSVVTAPLAGRIAQPTAHGVRPLRTFGVIVAVGLVALVVGLFVPDDAGWEVTAIVAVVPLTLIDGGRAGAEGLSGAFSRRSLVGLSAALLAGLVVGGAGSGLGGASREAIVTGDPAAVIQSTVAVIAGAVAVVAAWWPARVPSSTSSSTSDDVALADQTERRHA